MKKKQAEPQGKPVTITVERLSDNSRITFTTSSDKTIKHLRSLLNHHLPPYSPDKFSLYSYQRGALIHFHPPSFKLDYFPVIFDQSVLLLKMDDRNINNSIVKDDKTLHAEIEKSKLTLLRNMFSSKERKPFVQQQNASRVTSCMTMFKQLFHHSSTSQSMYIEY